MRATYYSHASISIETRSGARLVTDPWIYNPICANALSLFPMNRIDLDEYYGHHVIFISHSHSDHLCARTLQGFPRSTVVVTQKRYDGSQTHRVLEELGFTNVLEMSHRETRRVMEDLVVTMLIDQEHGDSAIIASDGSAAIFNQNDCFLSENDLAFIGSSFAIDVAFVFFIGLEMYPGCFEMCTEEKERVITRKKLAAFERARRVALLTGAKRIVPYSSDMTWLRRRDLARLNGALPVEFADFMGSQMPPVPVLLPVSGQVIAMESRPEDYTRFFRSKAELLASYDDFVALPGNRRLVAELQAFEKTFRFEQPEWEELVREFNRHLLVERNSRIGVRPTERLAIGYRLRIGESLCDYLFDVGPGGVEMRSAGLDRIAGDLHMLVEVDGAMHGMAQSGACNFDDLQNCHYFVRRDAAFNATEDYFWQYLAAITGFQNDSARLPRKGECEAYRVLQHALAGVDGKPATPAFAVSEDADR